MKKDWVGVDCLSSLSISSYVMIMEMKLDDEIKFTSIRR